MKPLTEQLFQMRNMIRHALPHYFHYGMHRTPDMTRGIARLMQISASTARRHGDDFRRTLL